MTVVTHEEIQHGVAALWGLRVLISGGGEHFFPLRVQRMKRVPHFEYLLAKLRGWVWGNAVSYRLGLVCSGPTGGDISSGSAGWFPVCPPPQLGGSSYTFVSHGCSLTMDAKSASPSTSTK